MTAVTGEQAGEVTGRRSRRRVIAVVVVIVVLAAGGFAAERLLGDSGGSPTATQAATTTAAVVRTDLAETTPVDGTIGYASATTIVRTWPPTSGP
jgi:flagellar basal body-associated protein FliL